MATIRGGSVSHSPVSILSQIDFNGQVLTDELLSRTFHQLMDEHGYVLMCNVTEEFDPVRFCRVLGSFVPNYTGAVVGDVRPEPGMDDVYHAGNTRPLTPHSEGYDFAFAPPRYIALWCITPASGPGGETTLMDTRPLVAALSEVERKQLLETDYEWKTTEGVQRMGLDLKTRHPILEENPPGGPRGPGGPGDSGGAGGAGVSEGAGGAAGSGVSGGARDIVRFSCNNLIRDDDDFAAELQDRWHAAFDREHIAVEYHERDMLIWDNWRLLHARNAFSDRSRHLRRIQIAG
ncbi:MULTISPECIES: TauD/TfdA family dioxygenase [unclassified Streptomyces]|uniref:TauD/TfdA family dioxygenase n=1 Tax=Streptomyces sp. DT24 TaxID=3416520 RepID=UPI003CE96180